MGFYGFEGFSRDFEGFHTVLKGFPGGFEAYQGFSVNIMPKTTR